MSLYVLRSNNNQSLPNIVGKLLRSYKLLRTNVQKLKQRLFNLTRCFMFYLMLASNNLYALIITGYIIYDANDQIVVKKIRVYKKI